MRERLGRALRGRAGIALLVFAGYLLSAFVAKNLYPFSRFDMYANRAGRSASRIVARDAAGRLHAVNEYTHWACPRPVDVDPRQCPSFPFYYIPYVDAGIAGWVDHHGANASDGEPVDLVFHVWRLGSSGVESEEDCMIERCRAAR